MTDPVLAPSTGGTRQARCGVWLFVPWFRDTQDCSCDLMEGNAIPTNHRFNPFKPKFRLPAPLFLVTVLFLQ